MDGYKLNKIAGAVLLALLVIMGIKEVNNSLNAPEELDRQAYVIEGVERASHDDDAPLVAPVEIDFAEQVEGPGLAMRLANADLDAGKKVFRKCVQCHTINEGGRRLQGPNLYGIVGAPIAAREGFRFSKGLISRGGSWTYENLDAWLTKPGAFVKRPKMILVLKKAVDRANVIAFMRSTMENPPALPVVATEPEVPGESPATVD